MLFSGTWEVEIPFCIKFILLIFGDVSGDEAYFCSETSYVDVACMNADVGPNDAQEGLVLLFG